MIVIRKPVDDAERDWADDEDRWMSERDYPDEYLGSYTEQSVIAEVNGVRCVVKVSAPEDDMVADIISYLCK